MIRFRKKSAPAESADLRPSLTDTEFMALWEKRWVRADGTPWEGATFATIATLVSALRRGDFDRSEMPANLPRKRRRR